MIRAIGIAIAKLFFLTLAVFLIGKGLTKTSLVFSPSAQTLCSEVRPSLTRQQVEDIASLRDGWQTVRPDGTMVISSRRYDAGVTVCRIGFDSAGRVTSKSVTPMRPEDKPSL